MWYLMKSLYTALAIPIHSACYWSFRVNFPFSAYKHTENRWRCDDETVQNNPEYFCCNISAIFFPVGPGADFRTGACSGGWLKLYHKRFLPLICVLFPRTWSNTAKKLQPTGIVWFGSCNSYFFMFYQHFVEEHLWDYTATFFSACLFLVGNKLLCNNQVMSTDKNRFWFFISVILTRMH